MSFIADLRNSIVSAFSMYGYMLRKDANSLICETLNGFSKSEREEYLKQIFSVLEKQNMTSALIDAALLQKVLDQCQKKGENIQHIFSVQNAFDFPKYTYNTELKKFINDENSQAQSTNDIANRKVKTFLDRYWLLYQRTSRHKLFTPTASGCNQKLNKKFQLRNVEYLLGCTSKLKEIIILGMIARIKANKLHLEDPTGIVEINLTDAVFQAGLFTENSFVLAEGWFEDEVFHITALGFPPLEPSKTTKLFYGNVNFFSSNPPMSQQALLNMQRIESNEAGMLVFLSDVHFDKDKTLSNLEILLEGFDSSPPICFVISGRFCSVYGSSYNAKLKEGLSKFAEIINSFPNVKKESYFVFVPSLEDCGINKILPRPSLPNMITEEFSKKITKAIFTSNPCRIQYFSQEIIVYCDSLMEKMCKNSIKFPNSDMPDNLIKSILSQSHLSPLPFHINPVYWKHSQSLQVYPLPNLLVLCDKNSAPFERELADCKCVNTGSFSQGDFSFKVYCASSRTVEDSKIEN